MAPASRSDRVVCAPRLSLRPQAQNPTATRTMTMNEPNVTASK